MLLHEYPMLSYLEEGPQKTWDKSQLERDRYFWIKKDRKQRGTTSSSLSGCRAGMVRFFTTESTERKELYIVSFFALFANSVVNIK